jgi:hypothetical protein
LGRSARAAAPRRNNRAISDEEAPAAESGNSIYFLAGIIKWAVLSIPTFHYMKKRTANIDIGRAALISLRKVPADGSR